MNEHGIKQSIVLFAALLKPAWLYYHSKTHFLETRRTYAVYTCACLTGPIQQSQPQAQTQAEPQPHPQPQPEPQPQPQY